jgi:hypothetical protein
MTDCMPAKRIRAAISIRETGAETNTGTSVFVLKSARFPILCVQKRVSVYSGMRST